MAQQSMVVTNRDCPGRIVPVGTPITIPNNTFITVTQALGGNYTVVYQGNMVRIDGTDADAIGMPKYSLEFPASDSTQIEMDNVWRALESVFDPEIPVNLRSLGLIYDVRIDQAQALVQIDMTLTAPGCGMGPVLVEDVKYRVALVPHVEKVEVELVFDPPWSRDMMSEEAQLETGMFY